MRVTNKQTANVVSSNLMKNQQLLLNSQIRLATQKKINKPSDDPIGMGNILDYRKIISSIDQYDRNIEHGKTQIEVADSVLDEIHSLLDEARQWALDYGSGNSDDIRETALIRVENIYDSIIALANTKVGESYIFSGHETNTKPYSRDANFVATYSGDNEDVTVLVDDQIEVKINANGEDLFDGGTDIFLALKNLRDAIDTSQPVNAYAEVSNLLNGMDQVQNVATESAVYYNRLESAENHHETYKKNIQDMLSNTEDLDMAQAIVELQLQETAYTTSLETASMIIQKSLADYIR